MNSSPAPSGGGSSSKRSRQSPEELQLHSQTPIPPANGSHDASPPPNSPSTSSFRNVSACNRCRLRKNRCDQNLPACSSCEKARVKCVGYDPVMKREIPRAYVYYLESRVAYLESLLVDNGIAYAPPEDFDQGTKALCDPSSGQASAFDRLAPSHTKTISRETTREGHASGRQNKAWDQKEDEADQLHKLVSNVGLVTVQGASDPRYLGSTSGISFARVVFAAVKSSVSGASSERGSARPNKPMLTGSAATSGTSMRDSFFGLQSRPTITQAPFPSKELGARLVNLYFEHANPQIPILHRGEFMSLFDRAYSSDDKRRSSRELYMLNIVFAIGAGIILPDVGGSPGSTRSAPSPIRCEPTSPKPKRQKLSTQQHQPEEYHASAMVHLESFLGSMPAADRPDGFGGGLEELQAVLLLAGFALLRPVAPGLWYIVGVAVRLAVDLGLHHEDGTGIDDSGVGAGMGGNQAVSVEDSGTIPPASSSGVDARERGRREWVRDLRRRLWWCVYSFDRLVSTCVGRPFGITDAVITTEFPTVLDDSYITTSGFTAPSHAYGDPSYKRVAHHYFRLRLLQSEILQVLQHRQAQQASGNGKGISNEYMHTKLPSPFLQKFESFRAWRKDIDRRLWEWKESAPRQDETTVQFSIQFLELNYWQAVIMLYRQSLSVPPVLAGEVSPSDEIASPMSVATDEQEDVDDVFLKVAEAGQKVLKLYRQLHRIHLVNYTFLATHHLFMAGIAFLYAIWHSTTVRSQLTLDDVDFTVLAATSVLGDLMDKCPPAEACRDAFDRMSKATVQMVLSSTGFRTRSPSLRPRSLKHRHSGSMNRTSQQQQYLVTQNDQGFFRPRRPPPQFDMNLRELFPEETEVNRTFSRNLGRWQSPLPINTTQPQPQPQSIPYQDSPLQSTSQQLPRTPTSYISPPSYTHTQPLDTAAPPPLDNTYQTLHDATSTSSYPDYSFLTSDIDSLLADTTATFNGHSGLNLGFDSEHDWSDGAQLDLFDGFFFGGAGMGNGMMGNGAGIEMENENGNGPAMI